MTQDDLAGFISVIAMALMFVGGCMAITCRFRERDREEAEEKKFQEEIRRLHTGR